MTTPSAPLLPVITSPPARPWLPWFAAGVVLGALAPTALTVAWGWADAALWAGWTIGLPLMLAAAGMANRWPWAARGLAFLAAGTLGMALGYRPVSMLPPEPRVVALTGIVSTVAWSGHGQGFILQAQSIECPAGYSAPARLFIRADGLPDIRCGDVVRVQGRWETGPRGDSVKAVAIERLLPREQGARGWAWQALDRLDHHRELGESLIIGQGSPPEKDDFRRSGLLHILAVSGSHLAIAAALGVWLLRWCGLPWAIRLTALGGLIGGYTWLTGGTPATLRALVMSLAILGMDLLAREPHRLGAISLAALVLTIIDPTNARDLGFQLSLAAVLGILTLGLDLVQLRERWLPLTAWPLDRALWRGVLASARIGLDGLAIGIAATLATTPVIAWNFGTATPWSPLTTLLATPPTAIALWMGLPLVGLAGIWPNGPWDGIYTGLETALRALASVVHLSAQLPGATIACGMPNWWTMLAWPLLFLAWPQLFWAWPQAWGWALRGGLLLMLFVAF